MQRKPFEQMNFEELLEYLDTGVSDASKAPAILEAINNQGKGFFDRFKGMERADLLETWGGVINARITFLAQQNQLQPA